MKNGSNGSTRPRRLLLCLDGVPHKLITDAKQRGLFDAFGPPTRLLSPFPTMTNVALSAMFDASPPAGYESLYFDKRAGELRGGIKKYLGRRTPDKIPSSYMDDLDYQEPLPFEFLIYVAPEKVWRADMRRFRERFRAAPQNRDYFAFLKATDGLLHAQGPERLNVALESLDKILTEIREYCGDETEIVMFSDHGMNLEENLRVDLTTQLRRKGFQVGSRLAGSKGRAVSIPAFGLCSYAAVYCGDDAYVPETARAITDIRGVDFVVYRDALEVVVESACGSARIERNGDTYRYVNTGGDPLELQSLSNEFLNESVWFEKTNAHRYPDVVVNLYKSLFANRVTHTADILISLEDGYYYGWSPFGRFVRLAATHGNALQSSSNAFLMSTHRNLPECVRADNASGLLRG
ncbi:MAG TPA: alkaline phosphatase family protein [Pyrinomonadaceae bacterium]|nr:alkaline phosphatase family protein [Pyrinomonadaceae bacterium]